MSSAPLQGCLPIELITAFAVGSLAESAAASCAEHIAECGDCVRELDSLCPLAASMPAWPLDVLSPPASLWERLAIRIASETGAEPVAGEAGDPGHWLEVSTGIFCKVLATDAETDRISMLVRLLPGVEYPPHEHADEEELHLLHGELWIDERRMVEGDYNRSRAGSTDRRVWSESGCTCVLITSLRDRLIARPES